MVTPVMRAAKPENHAGAILWALALTIIPGFVTMALLGTLRSYPPGLPGFWDYPSGTIGDALLVPTLIVGLLVQAFSLSDAGVSGGARLALASGVLGLIGGAAVPLTWLLGSNTKSFWMLPHPHDFVLAGWIHFVYLSCATAAIAALAVWVFRGLRALGRDTRTPGDGLQVTAMTLAVGAGLGMLVLIGRDSVLGGFTPASAATMIALLVVAVLFLGGLAWAARPSVLASHWRAVVIVPFFVAGLTALVVRWKPHYSLIVGLAAVIGVLGSLAATSAFTREPGTRAYRWPTAIAMTGLLLGGLVRAIDALARREPSPFFWVIGGVSLVMALLYLVKPAQMQRRRVIGYGLFLGYCIFMCYLAERLQLPHVAPSSAGASLAVADTAFDVLVISLLQSRFGELGQADVADVRAEYVSESEHRRDPGAYLSPPGTDSDASASPEAVMADVVLLGFAVGLGLLTLLAAAAQPLGLNRQTVDPSEIRLLLLPSVALLGLILLLSRSVFASWSRRRTPEPEPGPSFDFLELPSWYWVFPALGASAWSGTILALSGGSPHVPALAAIAAVIVFGLYAKSLVWNTTILQTVKWSPGQIATSIAVALSIALSTFWLVAFGMWQGESPVPGGWLSATALAVFLGNFALFELAGQALAWGVPSGRKTQLLLSRENVRGYITLDGAAFGSVFVIGVAIPLFAAARDRELHVSSLSVVSSMVFLPGLIGAALWGLRNWANYDELIQDSRKGEGIPRATLIRSGGVWSDADQRDRTWRKHLHRHIELQRAGVAALMALGLANLATVLLQ